MTKHEYELFVSHSTRRQTQWSAIVESLTARLRNRGIPVFWDADCIQSNARLLPTLEEAIKSSRVGMIVHTSAALESSWIETEIMLMRERQWRSQMRLMAMRLETGCPLMPGVPWDKVVEVGPTPLDLTHLTDLVMDALRG